MPNVTPHDEGIGKWSNTDVTFALKTSILPDGDVFGGAMAEVAEDATRHWTDDDRAAVAEYLFTVLLLADEPAPPTKEPAQDG